MAELMVGIYLLTIARMDSAVLHGTVDFSTTILSLVATFAMVRVAFSTNPRFAAAPLPTPVAFVGVLTHTKIKSASAMAFSMSVEKKSFLLWIGLLPLVACPYRPLVLCGRIFASF